jgi:hypothetical protein
VSASGIGKSGGDAEGRCGAAKVVIAHFEERHRVARLQKQVMLAGDDGVFAARPPVSIVEEKNAHQVRSSVRTTTHAHRELSSGDTATLNAGLGDGLTAAVPTWDK